MRQIVVHDDIRSLSFKVLSGAAETIGYGAIFESAPGVVVDNYSIRSNNGPGDVLDLAHGQCPDQ